MSFKPKTILKFSDGVQIESESLLESYDFKLIKDLQNAKRNNSTIVIDSPYETVSKEAKSLVSIEIKID